MRGESEKDECIRERGVCYQKQGESNRINRDECSYKYIKRELVVFQIELINSRYGLYILSELSFNEFTASW